MTDHDFTAAATAIQNTKGPKLQQEILMTTLNALAAGDPGPAELNLADDVELHIHGSVHFDGSWRGKRAVIAAAQKNYASVTNQKPEVLAIIQQEGAIAVRIRETGVLKTDSSHYTAEAILWYTFEGAKIKRVDQFARLL